MSDRRFPSLRHHKARGLAVVTLGGKDFYYGTFGSTESRREYDRVVGEWLAAYRPPAIGRPPLVLSVQGSGRLPNAMMPPCGTRVGRFRVPPARNVSPILIPRSLSSRDNSPRATGSAHTRSIR